LKPQKAPPDITFIAFEVAAAADMRTRLTSIRRYVLKHWRTHGPATHPYVRVKRGIPDAVILMFDNNRPEQHRHYIAYIEAEKWLSTTGRNETLDSGSAAA
jgi:hypothetical protein